MAVARYTLLELSRRRILAVFFIVGFLGVIVLGIGLRILYSVIVGTENSHNFDQFVELQFVSLVISALGTFGLLIAYGVGMTAIYHDLDSGAAVSIFSKPVSRLAFSLGKIFAGVIAVVVVVGLLAIETRLVMLVFGGGYEDTITAQVLDTLANSLIVMLIVLALSTAMNNIVAVVVTFVYYNVLTGVATTLHVIVDSGLIDNAVVKDVISGAYWLFPHPLTSNLPGAVVSTRVTRAGTAAQAVVPSVSGFGDFVWWGFTLVFFAAMVYFFVRRRQV